MVFEEVSFGAEMHEFKLNEPVEGELKEVKEDIGPNKSKVYTVGEKTFWGTSALDALMQGVSVGKKVRLTLIATDHKFPSGRTGRNFKVEVDR